VLGWAVLVDEAVDVQLDLPAVPTLDNSDPGLTRDEIARMETEA